MSTDTRIPARNIRLKRIYEPAAADDGARVLVDRLWPRGVSKERAALVSWCKDIAPRHSFANGHEPGRWDEFRESTRPS